MLILSIKSADNDILESCTKCLLWCTKLDNIVYIRFLVKMEKDVFSHAINTKQHTAIFGRCAIWLKQVSEGLKSSSVFPNRSRLRLDRFGNTLDDFKPSSTYFSQIAHLPQIAYAIFYKIIFMLNLLFKSKFLGFVAAPVCVFFFLFQIISKNWFKLQLQLHIII